MTPYVMTPKLFLPLEILPCRFRYEYSATQSGLGLPVSKPAHQIEVTLQGAQTF